MQYQEMSDEQLIDGNDNQHLIGGKINSMNYQKLVYHLIGLIGLI